MATQENLGSVQFVRGKLLGQIAWRTRGIADVLDSLQAKDILVVSELSRLDRSMLECRETLPTAVQKDVNVYAVNGAWRLDPSIQSYAWDFSSLCWDLPISVRRRCQIAPLFCFPRRICQIREPQKCRETRAQPSCSPGHALPLEHPQQGHSYASVPALC